MNKLQNISTFQTMSFKDLNVHLIYQRTPTASINRLIYTSPYRFNMKLTVIQIHQSSNLVLSIFLLFVKRHGPIECFS